MHNVSVKNIVSRCKIGSTIEFLKKILKLIEFATDCANKIFCTERFYKEESMFLAVTSTKPLSTIIFLIDFNFNQIILKRDE